MALADITINQPHQGSTTIDMTVSGSSWEQWFLVTSDRHHDNALTDWDLEKKHLEEAVERDAGILDFGDLLCLMQGKWDSRADISQCRPEHQDGRYLDSVVETAVDFYAPEAKNWIFVSPGNHETSVLRRHETDMTARFVEGMRRVGAENLVKGTYAGFIRFSAKMHGRQSSRLVMGYTHGYGGGGPVTKGVIQTNRQATYLPDCNIVVSGHVHEQWSMNIARSRLSHVGKPYTDRQLHLKMGGYKREFEHYEGWATERGHPPKPLGAWWIRMYVNNERRLDFDVQEAK